MKPILFNGDMVRAILDGRKTQTRRLLKPQPMMNSDIVYKPDLYNGGPNWAFWNGNKMNEPRTWKPQYQPGDVLYVRERARCIEWVEQGHERESRFRYEADGVETDFVLLPDRIKPIKWNHCVPNGCFRELARIFLKVTDVRVERVADICDLDALKEGFDCRQIIRGKLNGVEGDYADGCPHEGFMDALESVYPGSWERNDWVFVYEFERCEKP